MKQINDKLVFGKEHGTSIYQTENLAWSDPIEITNTISPGFGLADMYFYDASTGFVVTRNDTQSMVFSTYDYGFTWYETVYNDMIVRCTTSGSASNIVYIFGCLGTDESAPGGGFMKKSTNTGFSFGSTKTIPGIDEVRCATFDSGIIYVAGWSLDGGVTIVPKLGMSSDDGDTWTVKDITLTGSLYPKKIVKNSGYSKIWIMGEGSYAYSSDGGDTWLTTTISNLQHADDMYVYDDNVAYILGRDIFDWVTSNVTMNGGTLWTTSNIVSNSRVISMKFSSYYACTAIIANNYNHSVTVFSTNDYGSTWTQSSTSQFSYIYDYYDGVVIDSNNCKLLGRTNSGTTIYSFSTTGGMSNISLTIGTNTNEKPTLTSFFIKDGGFGGNGTLEYDKDNSAYYTDRSLIDYQTLTRALNVQLGNILFVAPYNSYASGVKGSIMKPYGLNSAISAAASGDLIVVMSGTYYLDSMGLPLKDGVNYQMMNANFIGPSSGTVYGLIMPYTSYVKCKIYGNATFTSTYGSDWDLITPYATCDITFEGMTFTGPNQIIGNGGGLAGQKYLTFKNCILKSTNNPIPTSLGARNYSPDVKTLFENCTIYGALLVSTANVLDPNILTFRNCELYGLGTNTNGVSASIALLDYYGNSDTAKIIIDKCNFYSPGINLLTINGYGAAGSNKSFIINDSKFINTDGWVNNAKDNMIYKLRNNWTNHNGIDGYDITNTLIGSGIITDSNLE